MTVIRCEAEQSDRDDLWLGVGTGEIAVEEADPGQQGDKSKVRGVKGRLISSNSYQMLAL